MSVVFLEYTMIGVNLSALTHVATISCTLIIFSHSLKIGISY